MATTAAAAAAAAAAVPTPLPAFAARIIAPAVARPSWRRPPLSTHAERPVVRTTVPAAAATATAGAAAAPLVAARSHWVGGGRPTLRAPRPPPGVAAPLDGTTTTPPTSSPDDGGSRADGGAPSTTPVCALRSWAVGAAALVGVFFPSVPPPATASPGGVPPSYEMVFSGAGSAAVPSASLLGRGARAGGVGVLPPPALSSSPFAAPPSSSVAAETAATAVASPSVAAPPTAPSPATASVPTPPASFLSPLFPGTLTDAEICLRLVMASLVGVVVALESRTPVRSTIVAFAASVAMTLAPPLAAGLVARSTALALLVAAAEPPAATGVAAAADAQALGSVSLRPRRMRMRKLRSSTKG